MTKTLLIVAIMSFPMFSEAQVDIHLSGSETTFGHVFKAIRRQNLGVGYEKGLINVNWPVQPLEGYVPLKILLKRMLQPKGLRYKILDSTIWITKGPWSTESNDYPVRIYVTGIDGEILSGATVCQRDTLHCNQTNAAGILAIRVQQLPVLITVSHTGYHKRAILVRDSGTTGVILEPLDSWLEQADVNGADPSGRWNRTSDMAVVPDVPKHAPAASTLTSFLVGRIPGYLSTLTSGIPGAVAGISIRGKTSIVNGNDPLIVIDDVPFPAGNQSISNIPTGNAAGSLSPLTFLTVNDIEKISVLKDADATAIYGGRGANGVILITTRRWAPEKPRFNIDFGMGGSGLTRRPVLMNTKEYLSMRTDAFKNDGLTPNTKNFPEQMLWDSARSVDYGKWAIGGRGRVVHGNISMMGGKDLLHYFAGANCLEETNVFPTHPVHRLFTVNGSTDFRTKSRRWEGEVSVLYGNDHNRQFISDLTQAQFLAPNVPVLMDQQNRPVFQPAGVAVTNPWYFIGNTYQAVSDHLLLSGNLRWHPFTSLTLRMSGGCSQLHSREVSQMPIWNQNPLFAPTGSSYRAGTKYREWIVEPQAEYNVSWRKWTVALLGGGSWQWIYNGVSTLSARGLSSDSLLSQPQLATDLTLQNASGGYLYKGYFARANFRWNNNFFLNLTERKDGCNRWGPTQYSNFGAIGAAWNIFESDYLKRAMPIISLARLRASYGVTGNDLIGGDSRSPEAWAPTSAASYQNIWGIGGLGMISTQTAWERVRKMELTLDLGMMRDRCRFTVSWYRHRSVNQLLPDSLPVPGSPVRLISRRVIVQNEGLEGTIETSIVRETNYGWSMTANITLPASKLVSFPSIDVTPFSTDLMIGRSLDAMRAYRYLGVNRQQGVYQFEDLNGDGRIDQHDRFFAGQLDVTCYGGWSNSFYWKQWKLETLIEGRRQMGATYQAAIFAANPPGSTLSGYYSNQPATLVNRWRKVGDADFYQMVSTKGNTEAGRALSRYLASTGILTDASFIRLKTVTLSYQMPDKWLKKMRLQGMEISLQALNLFTLTSYQDGDPEIQRAVTLPPMRSVIAGLHVRF